MQTIHYLLFQNNYLSIKYKTTYTIINNIIII